MRFSRQNKSAIKFVIVPFASGSTRIKLRIGRFIEEATRREGRMVELLEKTAAILDNVGMHFAPPLS